jgi:cardiolipin synthase
MTPSPTTADGTTPATGSAGPPAFAGPAGSPGSSGSSGSSGSVPEASGINWPNLISAARIVLCVPLAYGLYHAPDPFWRRFAFWLGAAMGVSDWLDGYLARRLNQRSRLGEVLDPIGDKFLVTAGTVLLALPGCAVVLADGATLPIPVEVVAAILGKDVVVVLGAALVVSLTGLTRFPSRWWGKASTTAQLIMLGLVLAWPDLPPASAPPAALIWLCWLSGAFALAATVDYVAFGVSVIRGYRPKVE